MAVQDQEQVPAKLTRDEIDQALSKVLRAAPVPLSDLAARAEVKRRGQQSLGVPLKACPHVIKRMVAEGRAVRHEGRQPTYSKPKAAKKS